MSEEREPQTLAELEQANQELSASLERCQALLSDYRQSLAATGEATFLLRSPPLRVSSVEMEGVMPIGTSEVAKQDQPEA